MKGFILAAGMGTRLKPWTDKHPKSLVPVGGVPMLERVVTKMHKAGIKDITINVHHFADQIINFIGEKGWNINISDERDQLLETGGGLLKASSLLEGNEPVLVHNVDILSNADFQLIEEKHSASLADVTLLVSKRESSRKLLFDKAGRMRGWHNLNTGEFKPKGMTEVYSLNRGLDNLAFSGIYMISTDIFREMKSRGWGGRFSIMDFLLATLDHFAYFGIQQEGFEMIDIGKPDSLNRANQIFSADKG